MKEISIIPTPNDASFLVQPVQEFETGKENVVQLAHILIVNNLLWVPFEVRRFVW